LTMITDDVVTYSVSASHSEFKTLAINTFVVDKAIEYYCNEKYKIFDFGISSPNQKGLIFFKSRWGGVTYNMPYYYYPVQIDEIPEIDFSDAYMWLRKPFKYVPIDFVKILSSMIVKYLN